jgi:DNA-binding NarL/FixJ family response regulator
MNQRGEGVTHPRILLADDHSEILDVVQRQITVESSIVGLVRDGPTMIEAAETLKPDVILLDISMPGMNGLEAARRLLALTPGMRIIFLTVHDRPFYVAEAFRLGARGYVLKRSAHELSEAIDRVMQGHKFISSTLREAHPELGSFGSANSL